MFGFFDRVVFVSLPGQVLNRTGSEGSGEIVLLIQEKAHLTSFFKSSVSKRPEFSLMLNLKTKRLRVESSLRIVGSDRFFARSVHENADGHIYSKSSIRMRFPRGFVEKTRFVRRKSRSVLEL